jgi:hypothetical protein
VPKLLEQVSAVLMDLTKTETLDDAQAKLGIKVKQDTRTTHVRIHCTAKRLSDQTDCLARLGSYLHKHGWRTAATQFNRYGQKWTTRLDVLGRE